VGMQRDCTLDLQSALALQARNDGDMDGLGTEEATMDDNTLNDLTSLPNALVIKLDERNEHILALSEEQRGFNREQVHIMLDLKP